MRTLGNRLNDVIDVVDRIRNTSVFSYALVSEVNLTVSSYCNICLLYTSAAASPLGDSCTEITAKTVYFVTYGAYAVSYTHLDVYKRQHICQAEYGDTCNGQRAAQLAACIEPEQAAADAYDDEATQRCV